MTSICDYCNKNNLVHVEPQPIINALRKLSPEDRLTVIGFIDACLHVDIKFHTTIAEGAIEDMFCKTCGHETDREEDDDRYIYLCSNKGCSIWK